jgi:16S rRNA (guanine966-N2)-methyltransferase
MNRSRPQNATQGRAAPSGTVRIVAGRWRGSKLPVLEREGLRPTSDRVRETLFNWLQPILPGARVLDLFAGSGALGVEALSRGAHAATFIERDRDLAASLRETLARLRRGDPDGQICEAEVVQADTLRWLAQPPTDARQRYDIVFLDPPFAGMLAPGAQSPGLWRPVLAALGPWLSDHAWLYLEAPRDLGADTGIGELDSAWGLHREGTTRDVRYALYRRVSPTG